MGPLVVEDIRDRPYRLPQVRIGNEGNSDNSGTGGNQTHFTAPRKTGTTSTSGFCEAKYPAHTQYKALPGFGPASLN